MIYVFVGGPLDGQRRTVKPPDEVVTVDGADYRKRGILRNTKDGPVTVEFYADEGMTGLDAVEALVEGYRKS